MTLPTSLRQRMQLIHALRDFFDGQGLTEVETPLLLAANAPEAHVDPLRVSLGGARASSWAPLRTSPELALKRLLAAGSGDIYEIARVLRDDPHGPEHRREFTLLEWYRVDVGYAQLMDDCDALLAHCAEHIVGAGVVQGSGGACRLDRGCERISLAQAFERYAGFDPRPYYPDDAPGLTLAARRAGVSLPPSLDEHSAFDDVFFAIALSRVEPQLGRTRPTIMYEWPASLGALARRPPERPEVALRFELYAAGLELANAFDELRDPVEQRARFEVEQSHREVLGRPVDPMPEGFLGELAQMPAAAGIAVGIERLQMLLHGQRDIAAVALPFGLDEG